MKKLKHYFPLFVDLSEKRILLAGSRERMMNYAEMFREFANDVLILTCNDSIDPELSLSETSDRNGIRILEKPYTRETLFDADIVLAGTGEAKTDEDIYVTCKCLGISVYLLDDPVRRDFCLGEVQHDRDAVIGICRNKL